MALALREKGWIPYRIRFEVWIAKVIDWAELPTRLQAVVTPCASRPPLLRQYNVLPQSSETISLLRGQTALAYAPLLPINK